MDEPKIDAAPPNAGNKWLHRPFCYEDERMLHKGIWNDVWYKPVPRARITLTASAVTFHAAPTPGTYSLVGIASNSVSVPLLGASIAPNPVPTLAGPLVVITLIVLFTLRRYQWRGKKAAARAAAESTAPTTDAPRPIVGGGAEVPAEDPSRIPAKAAFENVYALVNRARALRSQGAENQAVIALYGGAMSMAAELSGLAIEPGMTHLVRLALIEQRMPALGEPLRALTSLFELASYSGRKLSSTHVDAAIDTLLVLSGLIRRPETEDEQR